jgi:hypothetical protein
VTGPQEYGIPRYGQPAAEDGVTEGVSLADSPRLAQALAALDEVRDAPPAEQIAPLAEAQRVLRDTLDAVGDV